MQPAFIPPTPSPPRRARASRATTPAMRLAMPKLLPAAAAAAILLSSPGSLPVAPPALSEPPAPTQSASQPSPVSDPARVLTTGQAARLSARLDALREATGLRVLVSTRGATPTTLPAATSKTVVIAMDPRAGNVLTFSVSPDVAPILPPSFFIEAANRFGNSFYTRDNGLDNALLSTVSAIETCTTSGRVCRAVPGVSDDQRLISVGSAAVAGCVAGAASRTGGKRFNAPFLLLFSPLWTIFFVSFGVGPILARGPGVEMELAVTVAAFIGLALAVWAWVPISIGPPGEDGSTGV